MSGIFGIVAGKPLPEWAAKFDCESWAQFSLKFILSNPAVTGIVTETSDVRHVIDKYATAVTGDSLTRRLVCE